MAVPSFINPSAVEQAQLPPYAASPTRSLFNHHHGGLTWKMSEGETSVVNHPQRDGNHSEYNDEEELSHTPNYPVDDLAGGAMVSTPMMDFFDDEALLNMPNSLVDMAGGTMMSPPWRSFSDEEALFHMPNFPADMAGGEIMSPPVMNLSLPSGDSPGNPGSVNLWEYAEQSGKEPCIEVDAPFGSNQTLGVSPEMMLHFVNVDASFHMPIQLPVEKMMVMNPCLPPDDSPGNFDPVSLGVSEEVKVLQNWKEMMQSSCKQACFEVETPFLVSSVHLKKEAGELGHLEELEWLAFEQERKKQAYEKLYSDFSPVRSVGLWLTESRGVGKAMMEHNSVCHHQQRYGHHSKMQNLACCKTTFLGLFDRMFLISFERLLDHFIIYFMKGGVKLLNGKGREVLYLEVGNAGKKNHNAGISPALEAECMMQQSLSYEGRIPNEEKNHVVGFKSIDAERNTSSRKKDNISRWQKDHGITREVLEQQFDKSRDDAAKTLKVSTSTLKRACREFGITRWPNHKGKMPNSSTKNSKMMMCKLLRSIKGINHALKKKPHIAPCPQR